MSGPTHRIPCIAILALVALSASAVRARGEVSAAGAPKPAPPASGSRPGVAGAYALRTERTLDRDALQAAGIRRPMRLACDAEGNLHVLDADTRRIIKIDTSGHVLYEVGGYGADETSLELPVDIAVDRDGSLLVLDRGRGALLAFDRLGRFLAARSFQGAAAEEAREAGARLLLDRVGRLWLLAPRARDLLPLDDRLEPARTTRFLSPEDSVHAPAAAALEPRGDSWIFDAEDRSLKRFDVTGRLGSRAPPPDDFEPWSVSDLVSDAAGNVYAADRAGQRIVVCDASGRPIATRILGGPTVPWHPATMAVMGNDGRIAVADPDRCEIQILRMVQP